MMRTCAPLLRSFVTHVCALAALAALACATPASTASEPQSAMALLASLLEGCAPTGDDGVGRVRCTNGVMVAARARSTATGEALYRAEAYSMAAGVTGGRLVWDMVSIETGRAPTLVDRARAFLPGSDVAGATLIGVQRSLGSDKMEEIWCTAGDPAAAARCQDLLEAALSGLAAGGVSAPPERTAAGPSLFGRALSLPAKCTATMQSDGGDVTCRDGALLSWRRYDDVNEAMGIVQATLLALGDTSEGTPYPCTIGGERARCEAHPRAAAGLSYLDGKPVAVLCLGVEDARSHSLCGAIMPPVH